MNPPASIPPLSPNEVWVQQQHHDEAVRHLYHHQHGAKGCSFKRVEFHTVITLPTPQDAKEFCAYLNQPYSA